MDWPHWLNKLRKLGGAVGGPIIYAAAKTSANSVNSIPGKYRKKHELKTTTKNLLTPYFPNLDLNKIRYRINCTLPTEFIEFFGGVDAKAITFGNLIYFKGSNIQNKKATVTSVGLLVHELVHSDQVRMLGETNFAQEYGVQFLEYGYDNMPLEIEAKEFEDNFKENLLSYTDENHPFAGTPKHPTTGRTSDSIYQILDIILFWLVII